MRDLSEFMLIFEQGLLNMSNSLDRSSGHGLETTEKIKEYLERVGKHLCVRIEREALVGIQRTGQRKDEREYVMKGHVDLQLTFFDGVQLAIEIDRGNKAWSLDKLAHFSRDENCFGMWIRWRGRIQKIFKQNISRTCIVDITAVNPKISAVGKSWVRKKADCSQ